MREVFEDAVNSGKRETVECRPVVARMARMMEKLFARYDGDKTMRGETLEGSMDQLDRHVRNALVAFESNDLTDLRGDLGRIANRAALCLLILDEVGK